MAEHRTWSETPKTDFLVTRLTYARGATLMFVLFVVLVGGEVGSVIFHFLSVELLVLKLLCEIKCTTWKLYFNFVYR